MHAASSIAACLHLSACPMHLLTCWLAGSPVMVQVTVFAAASALQFQLPDAEVAVKVTAAEGVCMVRAAQLGKHVNKDNGQQQSL